AIVYIIASVQFVRFISPSLYPQIVLFLCLVANPFILDYLVAARGYGLALGFLLTMLLIGCQGEQFPYRVGVCSVLAGLYVASNFSFGFVCVAAMAVITGAAYWTNQKRRWAVMAAAVAPGALVTLFLTSWALLHWPSGELTHGFSSLVDT